MVIGGMGSIIALRGLYPSMAVSETHPKVLYWALSNRKYAYGDALDLEWCVREAQADRWR